VRLPRKRVLIRIVLYTIAFVWAAYGAINHWLAQRSADEIQEQQDAKIPAELRGMKSRLVTLPDGTTMKVFDLDRETLDAMVNTHTPAANTADASAPSTEPASAPAP